MNIIEKNIDELKRYENNPRLNEDAVEYVANSIKDFGFKVPLVIDKDNIIVCGDTRYQASLKLGLKVVPCVIADDLTEEQIKAYRLVDNKVAEIALWDTDKLEREIASGIDKLERYGFNEYELDSYGKDVDIEQFFTDEVNEPKEKEKYVCPCCGCEFE